MVCACSILAGRLLQASGALLVNESMPGREEGQNGRREFPLPLVWWECSVKLSLVHTERGADFWTHLRTTTANWSAQRWSIDVKRWFFKMGATSACQSAPATQRTARLHTEQRRSPKEVVMKGRCCSCILKVRLNDCQVEKTASGRRKLMCVSSENADLLANFRYDRVYLFIYWMYMASSIKLIWGLSSGNWNNNTHTHTKEKKKTRNKKPTKGMRENNKERP